MLENIRDRPWQKFTSSLIKHNKCSNIINYHCNNYHTNYPQGYLGPDQRPADAQGDDAGPEGQGHGGQAEEHYETG